MTPGCCAAVLARLVAVEARLAALEFSRPDRDRGAALVRNALSGIWADGILISAQNVLDASDRYPDLKRALHLAMIQNAAELGCWLRQHQGEKDGIVIARHGRRWVCTSSTYLHPPQPARR